ncbi:nucleoside diphosphate kinase [Strigomonas culicis]|uniref:Nucleoside diphosphate kinase n=1 Tax=Strigomonas culicis TaxID=28005 RepID=S9W0T9_9TRYP|nr:nucleoside-diphosphate kinase [Strigomonas culicis]EPY30165.1 nucleoside diphosphate kinase [Strigomonas culicis]EPY31788.1 nucleoside-diphosphate kinase [Strigomonas culicis]EPY33081.1 nucleoside diphosphate kinase [Strigomonas culicis]|eukprot:EPY23737.1 nucleoside-diphosphate kinase [Strigomonas culicis]
MSELSRYCFTVDYFDPQANLTRTYSLLYYLTDNTIEMFDMKTKRSFLKRCAYPQLQLKELYVGATISVYSRPLKIVDYGDDATRKKLSANSAEIMLAVSESGLLKAGIIIESLSTNNLLLKNVRLVDIPADIATAIHTTTRCLLIVVSGSDASEKADTTAQKFTGVVTRVDTQVAEILTTLALGPGKTTAVMQNCSVCVVKPHAVTACQEGPILQQLIDEGFLVSAIGLYSMSPADADDFLEVYSGVLPEFKKLVEQLSSGPCLAIEVCAENCVAALRAVCGPLDPEVGHALFPHTIRAKYGVDRVRNAVHCTDLEEDGPLESEFFFSLLQNK